MTAEIGQDEFRAEAAKGLALLRLMAEAADAEDADKECLHWVNRRVEQLEFVDERALRWRVSVDFEVPEAAPITRVADQDFRLVPLTSWEKDNLVAFDLRDEAGKAIWLPNSAETACLLSSALIYWAEGILNRAGKPEKVTPKLEKTLKAIVSEAPSPWQREESREPRTNQGKDDPFTAVYDLKRELSEDVAKHYLDAAPPELTHDQSFWSQVNELWRNFLIIVAVPDEPGTRRVFKMTFESKIDFRRPGNLLKRISQSMGWDAWQLEMYIGGRGGSHHLEVAAPPGVDIIRIRARPRTKVKDRTKYVVSYGGSPHVHLRIPAQRLRYKATTRVRVSRPGWLTTCWLAGLAITGVLLAGVLRLSVLFSNTTEAGTAATLLLALLAVVATMLVSPGTHPLASRLLWGARILILIDSGLVLLAAGSLLLNIYSSYPSPAKVGWWVLTVLSALCALGLTGSWLRPIGPQETLAKDKPLRGETVAKDKPLPGGTVAEDNKSTRKKKIEPPSLTIPAADGYHYGDDLGNEWDEKKQTKLVRALKATQADLLSVLAQVRGDYDEAARQLQRALDIFEQLGTLEEEREGSSPQPSHGT
jgi:hypothetical protein